MSPMSVAARPCAATVHGRAACSDRCTLSRSKDLAASRSPAIASHDYRIVFRERHTEKCRS
eukprot:93307-Chlamydomonas_euryale.AAC.3